MAHAASHKGKPEKGGKPPKGMPVIVIALGGPKPRSVPKSGKKGKSS